MLLEESITYVGIALAILLYIAYFKKCNEEGVASTTSWKPRLCNFKSHIKKNIRSYRSIADFINECYDEQIPFKYLVFVILDEVNNASDLTRNQIEYLLLEKKKIGSTL